MSEGISLSDLSPYARHLATESLEWSEGFWDPDSALLWSHRQNDAVLMVRNFGLVRGGASSSQSG